MTTPADGTEPREATLAEGASALASPVAEATPSPADVVPERISDAVEASETSASAEAASAEAAPAKTPDPELLAIRQENARMQVEMAELRRLNGERSLRETIANDNAALAEYKSTLEGRGFDQQTVAELVAERSQLQTERLQGRQQLARYQAEFKMAQESARATEIVVNQLSEKYGMPVGELHKLRNTVVEVQGQAQRPFDDPWILEAKAEAYQVRQELAKLKGGQVNPTKLATVQSSAGTGTPYIELLKAGKPLPSAAEIDRMTAKYLRG